MAVKPKSDHVDRLLFPLGFTPCSTSMLFSSTNIVNGRIKLSNISLDFLEHSVALFLLLYCHGEICYKGIKLGPECVL